MSEATASGTHSTHAYPAERYGWYVVFVLCLCSIVSYIDRQIINLLVEYIKTDLVISDTKISLLQGFAFAACYALAAIPLGRIADGFSRRWLIVWGVLAWTIAAFCCGLAQSYEQLFVGRIFVGIGEAALTPAAYSLLADLFRPQRLARPISVFTASSFVGSGVALVIGGAIISALENAEQILFPVIGEVTIWQASFMYAALPGFVVVLLVVLVVREPQRSNALPVGSAATDHKQGFVGALKYCRSNALVFTTVFLGLALLGAAQFGMGFWIPAFFIRVHGWAAGEIGYLQGMLFLVFGSSGVIAGGWLADRLQGRGYVDGNLRAVAVGGALAAPCALALALAPNATVSAVMLAPAMFFGSMPFGAGPAILPVVSPSMYRGQIVALYLLVVNIIGQAGGPWVLAMFTDYVYRDEMAIGLSLATVIPALMLGGVAFSLRGCGALRGLLSAEPEAPPEAAKAT